MLVLACYPGLLLHTQGSVVVVTTSGITCLSLGCAFIRQGENCQICCSRAELLGHWHGQKMLLRSLQ